MVAHGGADGDMQEVISLGPATCCFCSSAPLLAHCDMVPNRALLGGRDLGNNLPTSPAHLASPPLSMQDENIMNSMQLFENVI